MFTNALSKIHQHPMISQTSMHRDQGLMALSSVAKKVNVFAVPLIVLSVVSFLPGARADAYQDCIADCLQNNENGSLEQLVCSAACGVGWLILKIFG